MSKALDRLVVFLTPVYDDETGMGCNFYKSTRNKKKTVVTMAEESGFDITAPLERQVRHDRAATVTYLTKWHAV